MGVYPYATTADYVVHVACRRSAYVVDPTCRAATWCYTEGMGKGAYKQVDADYWLLTYGGDEPSHSAVAIRNDACGYWEGAQWHYWWLEQPLDEAVRTYVLERLAEQAYDEVVAMMLLVGGRRVP